MPRRPPARLARALVVGLVAPAAAGLLLVSGVLGGFERNLVDERYQLRGTHPTPDVVVVGIDEDTVANLDFPFHRALHARAIRALLAAGARAVAYDVQFAAGSSHPADDRELLRSAADPRVVLATAEVYAYDHLPGVVGARWLLAHGGRIGSVLLPLDADGVWRRMDARVQGLPALSVLAASGNPSAGEHPIDFAGPPGTVREIPFLDVLARRFDIAAVRNRVVVVGATALTLKDSWPTAAGGGLMPGPEIHANAIQTVLDGYPLRDASSFVAVLLVLAAGLLAPLATLAGSPSRALAQALGAGVLGVLVLLGGAQLAFDAGTIVPVAAPLLALALGTVGAVALTYVFEVRARQRLRATFERFVPPNVAAELLPGDGALPRLESRRLEATVLFCDLRGFTSLAERLEAEQVIAVLNRYLDLVSAAVFAHGGTVVSFQGDGVLAVFGAPLPQPDHAARALAAAREILDDALPRFNAWLLEERLADGPLDAGIGLNTGNVMSGLVGSARRVEYAAVGDATNVAARLQALGKDAPGRLFLSDSTHMQLGAAAEGLRRHGAVELRGRREAVTVYVAD
ncbi:MAG TPA: adenylate/guanylate cyclase domain-containing protein [Conexibacter sp.]|jgi:adenylate cyclase|nr:adenylate/guanylate cyclase domain-containing protein [Conexibacter sp.]